MENILNSSDEFTLETLKYFVFITIPSIYNEESDFPRFQFVFNDDDIENFLNVIKQSDTIDSGHCYMIRTGIAGGSRFVSENDVKNIISLLRKSQEAYQEYLVSPRSDELFDNIFISVNDSLKFFKLLAEISRLSSDRLSGFSLLAYIWLRMGPRDFNDVNGFLRRQLNFLENDHYLDEAQDENTAGYLSYLGCFNNQDLLYQIGNNEAFFETNRRMVFTINDAEKYYTLPCIHYGILDEDGKKVCYIYGIQDDANYLKSAEILASLKEVKKFLRNKFVNFTFPLVLKLFIDFLSAKGITDIRIPLLQVLNYPYHQKLSDKEITRFQKHYPPDVIARLESEIAVGRRNSEIADYLKEKAWYAHVVGKEDIISKNKTERLVEIFLVVQEKYGVIEFLSDSFLQDENLYVKILGERKLERNRGSLYTPL